MIQAGCTPSKPTLAPGLPVLSAPAIVFCARGGARIYTRGDTPGGALQMGKLICNISAIEERADILSGRPEISANVRQGDAVFITDEFVVETDDEGCILFSVSC